MIIKYMIGKCYAPGVDLHNKGKKAVQTHIIKISKGEAVACKAKSIPLCWEGKGETKVKEYNIKAKFNKEGIKCPECYKIWKEINKSK